MPDAPARRARVRLTIVLLLMAGLGPTRRHRDAPRSVGPRPAAALGGDESEGYILDASGSERTCKYRAMAAGTRDRLFDAARGLMAEDGLNINMHVVAERAGVTRMTLYRHFGTKQDLMLALTLHKAEEVRDAVTPILLDEARPAPERLVHTVVRLGTEVLATPFLHALFDRATVEEVDELDPDGHIIGFLRSMLLPFFEEQAASGRLRADAEACFLWTLRQVLAGLIPLAGVQPTEAFRREQAERFLVPSLFL